MLLLASSFSASFVQAAFSVNRDYIIKELCVNRFKPEMRCNGKCYMKKQMQQQEEQSGTNTQQKNHNDVLNWMFTGNVIVHFDEQAHSVNKTAHFADFLSIGFILSMDRPPPVDTDYFA